MSAAKPPNRGKVYYRALAIVCERRGAARPAKTDWTRHNQRVGQRNREERRAAAARARRA
jgi:hypothetical protein